MTKKDKIIKAIIAQPFSTLQELGNDFKVSRQYIHKILKNAGLHTSAPKSLKSDRYCVQCGSRTKPKTKTCSDKCRFDLRFMRVACSYCTVEFYRRKSLLKKSYYLNYQNIYCSQDCYQKRRIFIYDR